MKPTMDSLKEACPEIEERLLSEHLNRLNDRYYDRFTASEVCRHLEAISLLSPENPIEVMIRPNRDESVDCTVLAFDYPYEFSLLTGVFASMGFSILSGDVFTYAPPAPSSTPNRRDLKRKRKRRPAPKQARRRRLIIDHFTGTVQNPLSLRVWTRELQARMKTIAALLEKGDVASLNEARHLVGDWVVGKLERSERDSESFFPPRIEFEEQDEGFNRIKVISEDTPAFLYALCNALSLQDILIEHVRIRTIRGRVEDEIHVVDSSGKAIQDRDRIDRVKLSVLFTKQFTYFLVKAPDPSAALSRFDNILKEILALPEQGKWMEMLRTPHTMKDLARLLGISDFLWEDFIRLNIESLLPLLVPRVEGHRFGDPPESLEQKLDHFLQGADSLKEKEKQLNRFKDQEIFLMDLDHILDPAEDFRSLSQNLTALAECVVKKAASLIYSDLVSRYGRPRTASGEPVSYSILGMGKLGGAALGYASDIELQFVYSEGGQTDGKDPVDNGRFYQLLVQETTRFIHAKREGIFQVDLRLRPHGGAGPLAVTLETFRRYYLPGGPAHSFERLALVRMRPIGGDTELGLALEKIRDEAVYEQKSLDLSELRVLRERQYIEKTKGRLNAKYSPGGLVDLEYGIQIFQVQHGKDDKRLRTPRIHEAIDRLVDSDLLDAQEGSELMKAYDFLRNIINGMRMLRGSAKDLFLPSFESNEFVHLAKRMGYSRKGALSPAQQLQIEFEMVTTTLRLFYERHFSRDALPDSTTGSVTDLILSDNVPIEARKQILNAIGFQDPKGAYRNLKSLAGEPLQRKTFARLAVLARDIFRDSPDPDMALNNWERYIHVRASPGFHYNVLLDQPMRMDILLRLFGASHFLSDTLIRYPGLLDWVMSPEILQGKMLQDDLEQELRKARQACSNYDEWLNKLRRFRRRELLRIGVHDICLESPTREIMKELSALAESLTRAALEGVWERFEGEPSPLTPDVSYRERFCIMAFGKLGGDELNYSSDIDLLGVCADSGDGRPVNKEPYVRIMSLLISALSSHVSEGYAYRVDLRLRPFGKQGELVSSISGLQQYYAGSASLWEVQAALKMRPIAGNLTLGDDLLKRLRPILLHQRPRDQVADTIGRMRRQAMSRAETVQGGIDVKSGWGGLRDVEFLAQGLQLIHASRCPRLIESNTLRALDLLHEEGFLQGGDTEHLKEDYLFLRLVEHRLQILDDRQIHRVPVEKEKLDTFAKRVLGKGSNGERFMDLLNAVRGRIRKAYDRYLLGISSAS